MITKTELENLESALNYAVKQSVFVQFVVMASPEAGVSLGVQTVGDILANSRMLSNALETVDKLKKESGGRERI